MSKIIVLNPGHGGADPGAVGPTGLREHDVATDLCKRIGAALAVNPGLRIMVISQPGGMPRNQALAALAQKVNGWHPDLFLSVHCNASGTPPATDRVEAYYPAGDESSQRLARVVACSLDDTLADSKSRKWEAAKYYVLRRVNAPTRALLEVGFINRAQTEALMRTEAWKARAAAGVARGILLTLGLAH